MREVSADDLLRLRDIGRPDSSDIRQPSPLSLSPDGAFAAFVIARADPAANLYCRGVVILPMAGGRPRLLDTGGETILSPPAGPGPDRPIGAVLSPAPRWSPDGRWIAYLRRDNGRTQLWRVAAAGGQAAQLTNAPVDVEDFSWAGNQSLVIATRPAFAEFEKAVETEGDKGWLYDSRFIPYLGPRPRPSGDLPYRVEAIDADTMRLRDANTAEAALLDLSLEELRLPAAVSSKDGRAWIEHVDDALLGPVRLVASTGTGGTIACADPRCSDGITGLWWDVAGEEVRLLRREGWGRDHMALYAWTPGTGRFRQIMRSRDLLIGCVPWENNLVCLRETSLSPRKIISIDLATGRVRSLFDPNPEFARIRLGPIEHLHWRTQSGREARGDLVLPPGYRTGKRLPLIVVQYHSDGFLRGGTGDEYPIQLFAAHGFAVLSVEIAPWVGSDNPALKTAAQLGTASMKGWAERWNQLDSLMKGVDLAITRGFVDPQRMGITGLSDGATTARFALINRPVFAAAAISSCCVDPVNSMSLAGIEFADNYRALGAPPLSLPDVDLWQPNSLSLNARTLKRPILMQVADGELSIALESYSALRENAAPVELHVFPGEHHIKWQPAHRQAIYIRNLDWFRYWLKQERDSDPAKAAQYRRWDRLRALARMPASAAASQ